MSEPQHIERIYQEAFNSFEVKPDSAVWRNIKRDLKKDKKSKGVFWFIASGVLFLSLLISYNYTKENNSQNTSPQAQTTSREFVFDKPSNTPLFNSIPNTILLGDTGLENTNIPNTNSFFFKIDDALNSYSFNYFKLLNNYHLRIDPTNTSIPKENTIANNKTIAVEETVLENKIVKSAKNWEFTPYVSQTYFSSLRQGSPLDESLKNNKKEFETSQSFGLNIARNITDKWKVSAGLSMLKLNYSTYDITYRNDVSITNYLSGVEYNQYNRFTNVRDANSYSTNSISAIEQEGSIKQEIAYIEIPVNVSYQIKNKKHYDLAVTGGFSSLILTKNKLSLLNLDGQERYFGKANNLSPLNASANASLEFNYHITNDLKLNIRPSFKYYLDMFEQNSGGFKPYSVGVATGIKINF